MFVNIKGYEGKYKIDKKGNVLSCYRTTSQKHILKAKLMKQTLRKDGYKTVMLYNEKEHKYKNLKVHVLVLKAFVKQDKKFVNHKNGNRSDNNLKNLEWVTHKENVRHGEVTKLSLKQIYFIRICSKIKLFTGVQLSKMFNVRTSTISSVKNFKIWN